MKKRKGRSVKNAQTKLGKNDESEEVSKAPHTIVVFKGKIGKNVRELMQNYRKVMEPYTASNLKIRKGNVIKDYVSVAGLLNVTHLVVFSKSEIGIYVKVIRLPRGPTLTFKIHDYSLTRDVMSSLKRHINYAKQFDHHPLLVLNNFSGEGLQFKLMSSMFQNMFPSININSVKLNNIRRCVLFNYNSEDKTIDFRHFTIKVVPTGVSRSVKKIVQSKVPDLGKFDDVSEYIMRGNLSESEAEPDGPENEVTLPQNVGSRGNVAAQKSAVRLVELGPRIKLQLIKIEEGVSEGEVIFHELFNKTDEEVQELKGRQHKKKREKEQRKRLQETNKKKKEMMKIQQKQKSLQGMKSKEKNNENDEDHDEEWYKKEVGADPDKDLFTKQHKRKNEDAGNDPFKKRRRITGHSNGKEKPSQGRNRDFKRFSENKKVVSSKRRSNTTTRVSQGSRLKKSPNMNKNSRFHQKKEKKMKRRA